MSNRALVIRFLSGSDFLIHNLSSANDTVLLQSLLETLPASVDVQDAGTAFRFLTAALSITPGKWTLTGTDRLKERPVKTLVDALLKLGAEIRYAGKEGFAPLVIEGKKLKGGLVEMDASVSSQFVSALLMIAPKLDEGLLLRLNGTIASHPFIRMTLQLMNHFGVRTEWNENEIRVAPQPYRPKEYTVERDWTSASYWYEIAALSKNAEIILEGLSTHSLQGDVAVSSLMKHLGVKTTETEKGIIISNETDFHYPEFYEADCLATPDLAPAVIAAVAGLNLNAKISGVENLNLKESKRKDVLTEALHANGITIRSDEHCVYLNEGALSENLILNTHKDHRMAMCFAPLALKTASVMLDETDVVKKSYPEYWNHLAGAGFIIG